MNSGKTDANHAWSHLEQMFRDYIAGRPVQNIGNPAAQLNFQGNHLARHGNEKSNTWIHNESAGE